MEVLKLLINGGVITGICIIGRYILKYAVVLLICKHPELSNDKVRSLTRMITKDSKFLNI